MRLREELQTAWFRPDLAVFLWPLLPLSWIYRGLVAFRHFAFKIGLVSAERLPVPVIVVGNLIVGGAGKTPTVLWLVERLRAAGRHPGVLSRGYGKSSRGVSPVRADSDPQHVGDEPVLLATRSAVPVFVGRRRVEAGRALLAMHPEVDVLVCDDGLQHLALARDVELAVFDGRGRGNGRLLPAGPLREPVSRLATVDAMLFNSCADGGGESGSRSRVAGIRSFSMQLLPGEFYHLQDSARRCPATEFADRRLFALAGIGHPARFFDTLRRLGLDIEPHDFPDHHAYVAADLEFAKDGVLLMTEKDAIKCRRFYTGEAWVLPVSAKIEPDLAEFVLERIDGPQTA